MSNPFDDDRGGGSAGNKYGRTYSRDQEQLQAQCRAKQQDIENSTTNSLRLVQETLNIGAATAAELDSQGKQINRMHDNLVDINQSVKKSEVHVRGIKSIFGALWNKARGPIKEDPVAIPKVSSSSASTSRSSPGREVSSPMQPQEKHRLDTDRTHDNLVQIGVGVSSLREMALSMGDELERQNKDLEKVNREASKADMGVNKLNKDMTKILKNA